MCRTSRPLPLDSCTFSKPGYSSAASLSRSAAASGLVVFFAGVPSVLGSVIATVVPEAEPEPEPDPTAADPADPAEPADPAGVALPDWAAGFLSVLQPA